MIVVMLAALMISWQIVGRENTATDNRAQTFQQQWIVIRSGHAVGNTSSEFSNSRVLLLILLKR